MISSARAGALTCFAAAAAWPSLVGWLTAAMMSPLDRALRDAWCGVPLHSDALLLGHCAACWAGSLVLAGAGALMLAAPKPAYARS